MYLLIIIVFFCVGDILIYGESRSIQDLSGPLAQCMMDLPQVRLVVVTVGGALAMEMPDRYSYWQRILPLLLSGYGKICIFEYLCFLHVVV